MLKVMSGVYTKKKKILGVSLILGALLFFPAAYILSAAKKFTYVGARVCSQCHNESKTLNQYSIWLASPHARAVRILTTSKALKIAGKVSITNPEENLKCLKCHTTGGGKNSITKDEGVGCEACHGPGSGYYEISAHVDFQYRFNGYLKAKKNGMYPILKYEENLKKREKLCLYCHRKERPCWPETHSEILKQTLTIQNIDKLQKGDINFYHSLRNY
jgi:hypothetical protein